MSIREKLQVALECLLFGHVPFENGPEAGLPRVVQSKDVGNDYHDLNICERCGVVFGVRNTLTAEELAQEAEYNKALQDRMEKVKDEILKRVTGSQLQADGKNALN